MTSCQSTTDAVLEGSIQWQENYRNHNFKALSELYTPDCKVFPPGAPLGIGRKECEKIWEGLYKNGADRIHIHSEETVTAGGSMAGDRSRYVIYDKSGKEIDRGKYVVVWKNIGGKWYLHYDIFNSDFPKVKDAKYEVVQTSDHWEHYFRTGNFLALSRLYTEDCKVFPPGMPVAHGRDACRDAWKGLHDHFGAERIDIDNLETLDMGDTLAADRSSYIIYNAAGNKIDHGKYVVLWKKIEGKWYLHYDIFNSDVMNY